MRPARAVTRLPDLQAAIHDSLVVVMQSVRDEALLEVVEPHPLDGIELR
jgi:hypothetical protein